MWVLLLSALATAAPASTILRYERGTERYAIEKSSSLLILHDSPATLRIEIKACNRKTVDELWKEIEYRYKSLPELGKRQTAAVDNVNLDGKKRALYSVTPRSKSATEYFGRMSKIFLDAKMKSSAECSR
jgi:hypothetical protein